MGLERGTRIGLVAETSPEFLAMFYGCQYAGVLPCVLPALSYAPGRPAYVAQLARMLRSAEAPLVLASSALLACATEASAQAGVRAVAYAEMAVTPGAGAVAQACWREDEPAYVQFSSGSTALPRGVIVSQRALASNVDAILQHGLRLARDDRAFSWLPLYHDMGLVGFSIAALCGQCSVDYLAPAAFARRPALWLRLMSERRSTLTYAPAFGYRLAAERAGGEQGLDLRALRLAGVGGDMVRPDALDAFAEAFASSGFDPSAFQPSYGMAEATLAVTMAERDAAPRVDTVMIERHGAHDVALPAASTALSARRFFACGPPLPGWDLRVVGESGTVLPERAIGRVLLRGPALFAGYLGAEAPSAVFDAEGFFDTGDLGYRLGDELVPTGRSKDLILLRGRNLWPQDIEAAVECIATLRTGDAAAFAIETASDDVLVVAVHCRTTVAAARDVLRAQVVAVVQQAVGVVPRVVLVPAGGLPFTSSGKLSRSAARERYLGGAWEAPLTDQNASGQGQA